MAKLVLPFGQNPTEQAFIDWCTSKNIDWRDVIEYDIQRSIRDPWPRLTLIMHLRAEEPTEPDKEE